MQAMIESAATYTQSIYKCKGCPPQNQCTVLQFFIRSQLVWGGHSCPPPLILILISERLSGLVVRHTVQRHRRLQPASIQDSFPSRSKRTASPDTTIPSR